MTGRIVKRLDILKTVLIIGMAVLLNAGLSEGQTAGMSFDWEPFQARVDLKLHAPSGIPGFNGPFSSVEHSSIRASIKEETKLSYVKSERNLDIYKHGRMRLYLSHVVVDQNNIEVRKPITDANEKFNTIKSLPSMFLNSQYRDTFESVGKIFEPQLNLGIEF